MKKGVKKDKLKDIPVYEHLEYSLTHTSYASRLQWLQEANESLREIRKERKKHLRG